MEEEGGETKSPRWGVAPNVDKREDGVKISSDRAEWNLPHVVFIHGMFMNAKCWDLWEEEFQKKGLQYTNVSWPGRDGDPSVLRSDEVFVEGLRELRLNDVVEHYEKLIRSLPQPPVLIGHSMGGLVVQLLLQKGLGCAGVALNTAPPKGVFVVSWSFLKGNFTMVNPLRSASDYHTPSVSEFSYNFLSDVEKDEAEQTQIFNKYVVQESRHVPRDSQSEDGSINYLQKSVPLLITGGQLDNIVPSSVCKANFVKYANNATKTEFVEFAGKTHWSILRSPEVIDAALLWLQINLSEQMTRQ